MNNCLLILFLALASMRAFSQSTDRKNPEIANLSKRLGVTEQVAFQVSEILDFYKSKTRQIINDSSISKEKKRVLFDEQVKIKNSSFKKILTKEQLDIIIPTTEIKTAARK